MTVIDVDVDCEQCQSKAEYCVRVRKNEVLYDVYVCENDHYTYVKSCEDDED